jgi:hypothetical protein
MALRPLQANKNSVKNIGSSRLSDLRSLTFAIPKYRTAQPVSGPIYVSAAQIEAKMVLNRPNYTQSNYEFIFPFPPINIQYGGMSGQWVDLARPGRTPLVDYAGAQLLQVSFKFLVARPWDGLEYSVDQDIETLRYIASSQSTVTFFGFDGMMTKPFQTPGQPARRPGGFFFNVIEFSVDSIRRNPANQIAAAECSITLQEENNPSIVAKQFPPFTYPSQKSKTTPTKSSSTKFETGISGNPVSVGSRPDNFKELVTADRAERFIGRSAGYVKTVNTTVDAATRALLR